MEHSAVTQRRSSNSHLSSNETQTAICASGCLPGKLCFQWWQPASSVRAEEERCHNPAGIKTSAVECFRLSRCTATCMATLKKSQLWMLLLLIWLGLIQVTVFVKNTSKLPKIQTVFCRYEPSVDLFSSVWYPFYKLSSNGSLNKTVSSYYFSLSLFGAANMPVK